MQEPDVIKKVLIVDDEELVTEALERAFYGESFQTLTASSAEEAISILEGQEVSVIISDDHMPGLTGSQLMALARKLYPDTIRILLTGYATVESALKAINEGEIYRFFVKPCDFSMLKEVVLEALDSTRPSSSTKEFEDTIRKQSRLLQHLQKRCLELEERLQLYEQPQLQR
jgi:DNA-binding NtrC family response regulator